MDQFKKPLISIITVCYNSRDFIEQTILSVINLNFEDFEYIVIDGGSNDGTVEILKNYQDKITIWISESDNGIYDAMNKGINLAKGDWCYFLNAGDSFYDNNILQNFKLQLNTDQDVVYGSINCITKSNSFVLKPKPLEKIVDSMIFCHQAVFVKKTILDKYKFNINFKIAADFNLFRQLFLANYKFMELDLVIANYEAEEGVSSRSFYKMEKEYAIIKGYWGNRKHRFFIFLKVQKYIFINKLREITPVGFRRFVRSKIVKN